LNRKKTLGIIVPGILLFLVFSCKKNTPAPIPLEPTYSFAGKVQKGPYLGGGGVTVNILNQSLSPLGQTLSAQILSNTGNFGLTNIPLTSTYISLNAEGYYFNEITNATSDSYITLNAVTNLSDTGKVNVNVLTHLETSRVYYLVSQGESYALAKAQALKEILHIFSINTPVTSTSERLDISSAGEENAMLLALSVILQGSRTSANLNQLLNLMAQDIETDGVLNTVSIGDQLLTDVKHIDLVNVRNNLTSYYLSIGVPATIPPFEKYVNQFVDSTSYKTGKYFIPKYKNKK